MTCDILFISCHFISIHVYSYYDYFQLNAQDSHRVPSLFHFILQHSQARVAVGVEADIEASVQESLEGCRGMKQSLASPLEKPRSLLIIILTRAHSNLEHFGTNYLYHRGVIGDISAGRRYHLHHMPGANQAV